MKSDFQKVQILNISRFWMVGFQIPTVLKLPSSITFQMCNFVVLEQHLYSSGQLLYTVVLGSHKSIKVLEKSLLFNEKLSYFIWKQKCFLFTKCTFSEDWIYNPNSGLLITRKIWLPDFWSGNWVIQHKQSMYSCTTVIWLRSKEHLNTRHLI